MLLNRIISTSYFNSFHKCRQYKFAKLAAAKCTARFCSIYAAKAADAG